eukprot:8098294-Alexandrium_andersonii.AAC.1
MARPGAYLLGGDVGLNEGRSLFCEGGGAPGPKPCERPRRTPPHASPAHRPEADERGAHRTGSSALSAKVPGHTS